MKKAVIISIAILSLVSCKKEETKPTQNPTVNNGGTNNSTCDPDLVLDLEFNNSIIDSCNSYTITNNGAVFTMDRNSFSNKALSFDGSSYVDYPNTSRLKPNFPFSISFWINVNDSSDWAHNYFIQSNQRPNGGYNGYFVRATSSGAIYLTVSDTVSSTNLEATSSKILSSNSWVQYTAVVTSGTNVDVYWNGLKDTSANVSGNINTITYPPSGLGMIGGVSFSTNNGRLKGKMDKIKIYKKALTANEVLTLFNSTK